MLLRHLIWGWLLCLAQQATGQQLQRFFDESHAFFQTHIQDGKVPYGKLKTQPQPLNSLVTQIADMPLAGKSMQEQKAFYINAYNLLVIHRVVEHYPIQRPNEVTGFFDRKKHKVAGETFTLNNLEKQKLLKPYQDARLHFVLVCAARSCPPIAPFAYRPDSLEQQLDQQTQQALDDPNFIQVHDFSENIDISEIFKWYADDFKPSVHQFINQYRSDSLPDGYPLIFYNYDWTLNDLNPSTNDDFAPIISSLALPKGQFEIKIFNNLFSGAYPTNVEGLLSRSSYFSSFINLSYGLNGWMDLGFDGIIKSNRLNDLRGNSPFRVFEFRNEQLNNQVTVMDSSFTLTGQAAWGFTHLGPRIRFAPFRKAPDFSIEQAFYIPLQRSVDGSLIWVTQLYYNTFLHPKVGLFLAATIWQPLRFNGQRIFWNPPFLKAFLSWYPNSRFTLYATTTNLVEWGVGTKFLFTPKFELELLYTHHLPFEFINNWFGTNAMTFNLGLRYRI